MCIQTQTAKEIIEQEREREKKEHTHSQAIAIMKTDANDEIQIRRNNQTNRMTAK